MSMFWKKPIRCGDPAWYGLDFAIDDARIPESIRASIAHDYRPGYTLYFANTDEGGEWWLLDEAGDIVEAYWLV
ncbi:protein of unknown function [Sterolibacterium denitrificans]|uniref:Uncharacterized protein n=1 Tax=Sterolibacterium denitrificans TaxID=157592 RepID=A0A7Z7HPE0_9PROT|nr:hypothetical protein [Sterolibacterium denitrificans]SMB22490.1 protein of unknown function [Sterolibacterium denitrificans]